MAWKDAPTPNQVYALMRAYDAILWDISEKYKDSLDPRYTETAARQIRTRKEISAEIKAASHGKIENPEARKWLEDYFKSEGIQGADF